MKASPGTEQLVKLPEKQDLETLVKDFGDFEFRLEDPVTMLSADELFFDGKLVTLQLNTVHPAIASGTTVTSDEISSPETAKPRRRAEVSRMDPYLFSPKAPRCLSRWREERVSLTNGEIGENNL
ncbi:uncharacterized protein LOC122069724 [Macadamia integrifolia]|uniref:uncharacterized protein LOC122069724 n=1 Tax=Macadamia integrifolia TaxID=60698 RepID=UPI001C4E68D8|nr:uncharacterized protein LOC122069724 [Macadamia integrifolia]